MGRIYALSAARANDADGTNRPQDRIATKLKNQAGGATRRFSFTPVARLRAVPAALSAERPMNTGGTNRHFYASQVSRQPYLPILHAPPVSKLFHPCSVKITEAQDLRQFCMEAKTAFSAARSETNAPRVQARKYGHGGHSRYPLIFFSISGIAHPRSTVSANLHVFCKFLSVRHVSGMYCRQQRA